jgi:hypothetical protein
MTALDVINAALTRTGNDPITMLNDGSLGGKIASENYELLVKAELANYPWKRATKTVDLALLDPDIEGDPAEPWAAAFQLPTDFVEMRTVKSIGESIDFEVHGQTILANTSDSAVLHYVWRVPETYWPAWFTMGIIYRCEAMFLRAIGERFQEAQEADKRAEAQFARARNRDSQSQPPRDPMTTPMLTARRA